MKLKLMFQVIFVGILSCSTALAGIENNQAAVQKVEVKFQPQQGEVDGYAFQAMDGTIVFPLNGSWGGQIDFLAGDVENPNADLDIQGYTLHIFRRNPKTGMLDFSVSNMQTGTVDYGSAKLFGAYYWDKRTVSAATGYQFGDIPHSVTGSFQFREYFSDTLTFSADASAYDSQVIYGGGFDFKTPLNGLHLFAQSFAGNEGFDGFLFGLKLYFGGGGTTTQQRDRQLGVGTTLLVELMNSLHEVEAALPLPAPAPINVNDEISPP